MGRMAERRLGGAGLQEDLGEGLVDPPPFFQLDEATALLHSKLVLLAGIVSAGRLKP